MVRYKDLNANFTASGPDVQAKGRAPHDGEYVGTIEVLVLRCHSPATISSAHPVSKSKLSTVRSISTSDNESDGEYPVGGLFDGAYDPKPTSRPDQKRNPPVFGLDGPWDDRSAPPPKDKPKMGALKMTSQNTGTWNPVPQESAGNKTVEKSQRGEHRSKSRDHYRSDQKTSGSNGSQHSRSRQDGHATKEQTSPVLHLRGGAPGSYTPSSVSTASAMRHFHGGPPPAKDWTKSNDKPPKGNEGPPPALDPWTADIPAFSFEDAPPDPATQASAWQTWGTSFDNQNPVPGAWEDSNAQTNANNGSWGADNGQNKGNNGEDWNNHGDRSNWDAPKTDTQRNGNWGANRGNDAYQDNGLGGNGKNHNTKRNGQGETADTGNHVGQNNNWRGESNNNQQSGGRGANDTPQVTPGAKDPQKGNKPPSDKSASVYGGRPRSAHNFGKGKAKGSTAGSIGKPSSIESESTSLTPKADAFPFGWVKGPQNTSNVPPVRPIGGKRTSVPGAWSPPLPKKPGPEPAMPGPPRPAFSMSTPPEPKPYWPKWRGRDQIVVGAIEDETVPVPEEPIYEVPVDVARRNMTSHQVRPAQPTAYYHRTSKPRYMDTHETPYAVFVFKYRDQGQIFSASFGRAKHVLTCIEQEYSKQC